MDSLVVGDVSVDGSELTLSASGSAKGDLLCATFDRCDGKPLSLRYTSRYLGYMERVLWTSRES